MKLHELQPAPGSHKQRTRVGRGIAAGKGKTAGRGTKGQKARAGGSIPPWFEGGQTPLHMRIPKLRGFKNRFKIEYEVVNVGAIGALAERGAFELEGDSKKATKSAPVTVNQDILRAVGLVRTLNKPLKILGAGELSAPLFVVADAFTASARAKIEAAGGSVNVLEIPSSPLAALGVTAADAAAKPTDGATPARGSETETTTAAATGADADHDTDVAEPSVSDADGTDGSEVYASKGTKASAAKPARAKAATTKAASGKTAGSGGAKASAATGDEAQSDDAAAAESTPDETERPSGDDA
jgi:large subunit ribosomal protein L15